LGVNPEKSTGNTSGEQKPKKQLSDEATRKLGQVAINGKK
jgi:hypothetical protein